MTDHRAECHDGAFDPVCAECVGGETRTHTRMLDQMRTLLTEIRDRLPEPEGVKDAPADDGLAEWECELLRPATFALYPPTEGETNE